MLTDQCYEEDQPQAVALLETENGEWTMMSNKKRSKAKTSVDDDEVSDSVVDASISLTPCPYNQEIIDFVQALAEQKPKLMIIMRGCSGSGKTTLANRLKRDGVIVSADNYFVDITGTYVFEYAKLTDAHNYSMSKANQLVKKGRSPIIIDNTNLKISDFKAYIKMAVREDYYVQLVEPATPWRYKADILCERSMHAVPHAQIKRTLELFQRKVDLDALQRECANELAKTNSLTKSRAKPGRFISNFNEYVTEGARNWALLDDISNEDPNLSLQTPAPSSELSLLSLSSPFSPSRQSSTSTEQSTTSTTSAATSSTQDDAYAASIEVSTDMLAMMFPHINTSIISDFLWKYENDLDVVTNILLDSIDLEEQARVEHVATVTEPSPPSTAKQVVPVPSLRSLCITAMNRLEEVMGRLYEAADPHRDFFAEMTVDSSPPVKFTLGDSNEPSRARITESSEPPGTDTDEEAILSIKLNQQTINTLVELFGDREDEKHKDCCDVELSLNLAFKLFSYWKKTTRSHAEKKKSEELNTSSEDDRYIDAQDLSSIEYMESNCPKPLRQIIAEQQAEEKSEARRRQKEPRGDYGFSLCSPAQAKVTVTPVSLENEVAAARNNNSMANLLKQQVLYEKYANYVDKPTLDEIFRNNNNHLDKTCNFIDSFFGLAKSKSTPQYTKKLNMRTLPTKSKSSNSAVRQELTDALASTGDLTQVSGDFAVATQLRASAVSYHDLRRAYFDKATVAHAKGWGAVAQYYAEMGHNQTGYMQQTHKLASLETFVAVNSENKEDNSVDLHGLHVKEAIAILKNVIAERKKKLATRQLNGKRAKSHLFVITGSGHNSQNGPRLRPNVINFLSQSGFRFSEPHHGLLRIELSQ